MNRPRRAPAVKPSAAGETNSAEQQQPTPVPQSVGPRNYSYQNTPKRTQIPPQAKTSQPPTNVASKQLVTTPQLINKTTTGQQNPIKDSQEQAAIRAVDKTASQLQTLSEPPVKDLEIQPIGKQNDKIDTNISVIKVENDSHHVNEENGSDDSPRKKERTIFKNIFANRKKPSVRAKEKKIRQNRQLRKVILPKNALMALNEVKGINIGDFVINSNVGGGFTAVVNVNDMQYEGKGQSKVHAKNNACEKALRDYVLAKMRHKRRASTAELVMDTTEAEGENGIESDGGDSQKPILDDTDDVPMINLTSFALYKLFSDWENDGYEVPEFHPSCPTSQVNSTDSDAGMVIVKEPKKPTIRNNLPENWQVMHPATLLCIMRPGLTYSDYGVVGDKPHTVQNLGIIVDGREFIGRGRSKKIARRNTASAACNALFGTNFDLEEESETELNSVES